MRVSSVIILNPLNDFSLTDDRQAVLTIGTRVPVHFENQVITASVANLGTLIDAAKIKNRNEAVYALVRVVSTEEDQVSECTFLSLSRLPVDISSTCVSAGRYCARDDQHDHAVQALFPSCRSERNYSED